MSLACCSTVFTPSIRYLGQGQIIKVSTTVSSLPTVLHRKSVFQIAGYLSRYSSLGLSCSTLYTGLHSAIPSGHAVFHPLGEPTHPHPSVSPFLLMESHLRKIAESLMTHRSHCFDRQLNVVIRFHPPGQLLKVPAESRSTDPCTSPALPSPGSH